MKRLAVIGMVLAVSAAGCGGGESHVSDGERAEVNVLALYCFYGSQSKAEFKGCLTHVSPEHILRLAARYAPTPAAEFAVGTRADCGYTSGPMCSQAHRVVREAEAQYP